MDPDVKLYIKPGIFANQSKLYEYSSSYQGLHSEESLSLSYSQEKLKKIILFLIKILVIIHYLILHHLMK